MQRSSNKVTKTAINYLYLSSWNVKDGRLQLHLCRLSVLWGDKQEQRPHLDKFPPSTPDFLKHHVLHNEREITLISDVVMQSSSLFEKRLDLGFSCLDVAVRALTEYPAWGERWSGNVKIRPMLFWHLLRPVETFGASKWIDWINAILSADAYGTAAELKSGSNHKASVYTPKVNLW